MERKNGNTKGLVGRSIDEMFKRRNEEREEKEKRKRKSNINNPGNSIDRPNGLVPLRSWVRFLEAS